MKKEDNVEVIDFTGAISERYLSYALSTIMSRSLPDVRDGLKPVHRRILYAMMNLRLDPNAGYKKCARIVGDVIGKYHPHGDVAIYDTLVRLSQEFSLRYPLINGQGNFGSIDGDNAAAMRYTEARMTEICLLIMQDLDQNTVDFRPTYDNSDQEPELLPSAFPNLLANGSEGIAVGMATSIPPHNLDELCDALIHMIDSPDQQASCQEVMKFVKGPDLPTGGVIIDLPEVIINAYSAGKGSFRVRAKWQVEKFSHGLYQIVIDQIPYQVQKSKLIEQIADLMQAKKLPLIANIRDESAEEIRIVIEPKGRSCSAEVIMESLFKLTALESRVHLNMNVLDSTGAPRVMNIAEILHEFLQHRKNIILRRTEFQIGKINDRLEILRALQVVYLNIDQVIQIIREEDHPKQVLMETFAINANQAEAILNIKLRSLRKLEEEQINAEYNDLEKKLRNLNSILKNPAKMWEVAKIELQKIKAKFGQDSLIGKRRTDFQPVESAQVIDISAFIEKEPVTIIYSKMGWIKAVKNHNIDFNSIKFKEGDKLAYSLETYTTNNILICTDEGKFFTILAGNLSKGKGQGESLKLLVDIGNHEVINILPYQTARQILVASNIGKGFLVNSEDLLASSKNGKQIMNLKDNARCKICKMIDPDDDMMAIIGSNRKLLVINKDEIPVMKRGSGVTLQKYKSAQLSDIKGFNSQNGLSWSLGSKTRTEKDILDWRSRRGAIGKIPPTGFPKNNKLD